MTLGARVTQLSRLDGVAGWQLKLEGPGLRAAGLVAGTKTYDQIICSAPLSWLVSAIHPAPSPQALEAAASLKYRDFITVAVMLKTSKAFPDQWIYIHDPDIKAGRIQNFANWSPEMVPDPSITCLGLEYFCFQGDALWSMADDDLIALASRELVTLGLADNEIILDGAVVRQPKAYPVYDDDYARHVETIRREIDAHYPGLHLVGRNGMHKYNNQDHAMMTAMLTARNILANQSLYDVWNVNQDAEYHEAGDRGAQVTDTTGRLVPRRVSAGSG